MDLGTLSLGGALSPITRVRRLFTAGEVGVWYDLGLVFQDSTGTIAGAIASPIGKSLDKSGNGYHATQATSTARPILGRHPITGRRNLLTYTEDFSNAVWALAGTASKTGTNQINFPAIGDRVTQAVTLTPTVGETYTGTIGLTGSGTISIRVDTSGGTYEQTTAQITLSLTPTIFTVADLIGNISHTQVRFSILRDTADTATSVVMTRGAQLELAATSTAYQKVVSTYDVTEAGVNDAYYSDGDGVDDSFTVAAGGGGSTGFFLCTAVRVDGGAGTNRVIYSDAGTNTGYILRLNASNQLELAAGNGTAYTLAPTTATLTAGPYVVTAWDDGTNLNVQVNSGAVDSVARPVVSAGNADFRIGKDYGAATGYFNGAIYSYVYVKNGQNVDEADRAAVKKYIAGNAGVSI